MRSARAVHARAVACMAALVAAAMLGGCTRELRPFSFAPESPSSTWTAPAADQPPRELVGQPVVPRTFPPDVAVPPDGFSVAELVDLGLRANPATMTSWANARAAAAAAAAARGPFYPQFQLGGSIEWSQGVPESGAQAYVQKAYGPSATLNYLLLDFGGRSATAEVARQQLVAANFQHNQEILDVTLQVAQAYYTLVGTRDQLAAAEDSLRDAEGSLAAAKARMAVSVGTAYDALQAEATAANTELNVRTLEGQVRIARGTLATALGLRADTLVDVRPAGRPAVDAASRGVEDLIALAKTRRPDLAAQWATLRAAEAAVREARSAALPTVSLSGTAQRYTATGSVGVAAEQTAKYTERGWPYSAGITVTIPIFQGGQLMNQILEAEEQARAARAQVEAQEQTVIGDVWASYANLRTAGVSIAVSDRLLTASQEAFRAAQVAYANGLGDITALLNAQTTLAAARIQEAQVQTSWFLALAQLVHDVGALGDAVTLAAE